MKSSMFSRALGTGALYIAVFVLLVLIQFPAGGPITASSGGVSFKGLPGPHGAGIRSAELTAAGLRLVFSERQPLILVDETGVERENRPVSYTQEASGFIVEFDDGTTLEVSSDGDGQTTWWLRPAEAAASARIRYELAYGAALLAPGDDGAMRLSLGSSTYRVSGLGAIADARTLTISSSGAAMLPFAAALETAGGQAPVASFIAQAPMPAGDWSRILSSWRDKLWQGLTGPTFDAAAGLWTTDGTTTSAFNEERFIAYEAEALRRALPEQAAALVAVVRERHASSLSYRSAPFAGKTLLTMAAFEEDNVNRVKAAERMIQSRSADLFYTPGIIPLLLDRAPNSLAREAVTMARTADFSRATVVQTLGVIEAYLDAERYLPSGENPFATVPTLVDKIVLPAIRKAGGGFYLQTAQDGACDTITGVRAGRLLVKLADSTGTRIYEGIGQSLVASLLTFATDDGSLPAMVRVASGAVNPSAERVDGALLYPLLGSSPYYPRIVSLYATLGPGSWAWTCSPSLTVESNAAETVFKAEFPIGFSHYLVLYGVQPFAKIQLYGLDYNMDASFENYNASGYFYKKNAGAMYLKMRHKAPTEAIRLFY
ncbi:MAG: hypothetical protein JXM71_09960 [Spirochaetales bacterium]|nr:hypothetical protein [Spirochaetales bacterium]